MNEKRKYTSSAILILGLMFGLLSCGINTDSKPPKAQKGVLNINLETPSQIALEGEWEFYWSKLLNPADFQSPKMLKPDAWAPVPGVWNDLRVNQVSLPSHGYATYRLRVHFTEPMDGLALKIPTFSTAAQVFVNGKIQYTIGKVATNASSMIPSYEPRVVEIPGKYKSLEIIVQVSNFYYTKGGIWQTVYLGKSEVMHLKRRHQIIQEIFLAGSIFIMFLYNAALFFTFRKEKASLYFAGVCLFVSVRTLSVDEYLIREIIPMSWSWLIKMEYLSYYLTVWVFAEFAFTIFVKSFSPWVIRFSRVFSGIFVALVLFGFSAFYTSILLYYHAYTLVLSAYFTLVLVLEMIRRFRVTILYFIGWVFLFLTLLNDMLYNLHLIKTGNYGSWGIFIFMLFYTYVLTRWIASIYKKVDDLNIELLRQNTELEQMIYTQTRDLEESNQNLKNTNRDLSHKNKKVEASINYAQRIQNAILPSLTEIQTYFPDSFVFYKPRDVVSGDFYWFGVQDNIIFVAAMDCTGHGVPGAFMSMMGNDLLREIIHYQGITDVAKILNMLNDRVSESMKSTKDFIHDGMDISLVAIHPERRILEFAGAHLPLYLIQKGKPKEIQGDRLSVGNIDFMYEGQHKKFTKHTVYLNTPTVIYLFSDGFQDQFGGVKNRKYMAKRFKKLLYLQHKLPMSLQKNILEDSLHNWLHPQSMPQKIYEQIDDIMVIGISLDFS